ncbi:Glycosyl transferase family 2 [Thalassoglobus neptunius]|uniref:Glycosyl transferase family 2 n=1 Tax=Thalassoglobus neptunius TaxID=1938619 RepID=A0A5C5VZ68_9PLAN|nr:glycosyltransferase [Thalassoglobus neptunius]TWT43069.1 Glycosyl transferase family 2 [Thalassoglobus neptunius]
MADAAGPHLTITTDCNTMNSHRLPTCNYRIDRPVDDSYFCRHRAVRAAGRIVGSAICAACELHSQTCGDPIEPPSPTSTAENSSLSDIRKQLPQLVTIGITAFRRPEALRRFVASIRRYYPTIPIIIGDNGDQPVEFDDEHLVSLALPFDCGISAARNAIVANFETPYLLITEDDFEFTSETLIERFVDVLDQDPTIGAVGGSLEIESQRCDFAGDFELFRRELFVRQPARWPRHTSRETHYQIVDLVFNFVLARRELLEDHLWDERLKICEHVEYFYSVWRAANWRVAVCRSVTCIHHQDRSNDYNPYRFRQNLRQLTRLWLDHHHLDSIKITRARSLEFKLTGPPNILLFGVGHSGTSIVTRMIQDLGWHAEGKPGDLDEEFAEHIPIRDLNTKLIRHGEFDDQVAKNILTTLPRPWVIKDPRFVHTMTAWMECFADYQPLLVWLVRDVESVKQSFRRRQRVPQAEPISRGMTIDELMRQAEAIYKAWPWRKLRIQFENIGEATQRFCPERAFRNDSRDFTNGSSGLSKPMTNDETQPPTGGLIFPKSLFDGE